MQGRNGSRSSHALPMSSPTVPRISPHLFSLTEELPTSSYSPNPGTTTWPQQNVDHFTRTDPHSVLPSEQTLNTQHQHTDGSNPWYQDYPTATPAPPLSMPFSDAAHRNNQDMAAFMGDIDLSHMSPASRAASASGSCFSDYRCQGQSVYHNGYVAQPPSLSSPHQHLPADFPATQMSHSLGLPVPLWVPHQWNSPEHDSVSSQGTRGL